jgi:hypothetical protein
VPLLMITSTVMSAFMWRCRNQEVDFVKIDGGRGQSWAQYGHMVVVSGIGKRQERIDSKQ